MDETESGESAHPNVLKNEYPSSVLNIYSNGVWLISNYGWFLLAAVILVLYLRSRFQSRINQWQKAREESNYKKYDSGTAQSRLEAMERARERMQEQLNAQAAEHMEKQKQKEEEKRKQKIADWEGHLEGKGYRSKYKPNEGDGGEASGSQNNPKPKKPLRQTDYNPLMGSGGGASYRPSRRMGGGGGG